MRGIVLASGSSGNSLLLEGSSGALLIDAGLSAKEILRRISAVGSDPAAVSAILVSHEHTDHIRGLSVLSRRLNVPVIGTLGTHQALIRQERGGKTCTSHIQCAFQTETNVGDFVISPFPTCHDAIEPCGFLIRDHDLTFCTCTDTGLIPQSAKAALMQSDGALLESNHCPKMLDEGPYPHFLKQRIRSRHGHLSNTTTADLIREMGSSGPAHLLLAHLSEVNNTPERALASAMGGLGLLIDQVNLAVAGNPGSATWPVEVRL